MNIFRRIVPGLAVAAVALCASCGGGGKSVDKAEGLTFDSIVVDTVVSLGSDTLSPRAEIRLSIVYAKGEKSGLVNDSIVRGCLLNADYLPQGEGIKDVPQAVRMFTDNFIAGYKKDYGELYNEDKSNSFIYNVEYICNTRVTNEKDGIINYIADTYQYYGGAHGAYMTTAYNIDMKSGKILKLDDIFVPGYKRALTDAIVKKICEDNGVGTLQELQELYIFSMGDDPYPSENFIIKADGIEFIYVDMEIAPHAVGEIRAFLKNSEIEDLFKK